MPPSERRREEGNVSELTDEFRALLSERRYAVLATQDPDGTIHQTPVWFMFEEGRFYIESNSSSRKVTNLRLRPAASITVDAREPGIDRWVCASGATDILSANEAQALNANSADATSRGKPSKTRELARRSRRPTM